MAPNQVDRFTGAMLGGLIGDCLGATFEMRFENLVPVKKIDTFFEDVENMDIETDDKFQYTDDTAMARQIALSFIEHAKLDSIEIAKSFSSEYFHEPWRGYGGSVVEVFDKLRSSKCQDPFKPASEQFDGSGSYGNGAGMRAHPIALACAKYNPERVIEEAKNIAKLTHSHPLGVHGGVLQTMAVYHAVQGDDTREILEKIKKLVDELEKDYECTTASTYKAKLELVEQFLDKSDDDLDEICFELGNDVSAVDSVPTALFCFLKVIQESKKEDPLPEDMFERVLRMSIRMGGDTDTIASMACSITGAYLGRQAIPANFVQVCENWEEVEQMGKKIYEIVENSSPSGAVNGSETSNDVAEGDLPDGPEPKKQKLLQK
eukprot:TRINITY_DN9970_c0_g1_i1.p1 TRINITY_DN9970_c0_g1~~TRINITY_DN9970_c0_g1_i1.p1  ORF type:complete len:376 (-),score=142.77 TRINITY_DN9970_c0_g1_i1:38-1165(-)